MPIFLLLSRFVSSSKFLFLFFDLRKINTYVVHISFCFIFPSHETIFRDPRDAMPARSTVPASSEKDGGKDAENEGSGLRTAMTRWRRTKDGEKFGGFGLTARQ